MLADLAASHRQISSLRARFVQEKHVAIVRDVLRSSGKFLLDKKTGIAWIVEDPEPLRVVILEDGVHVEGKPVRSGPEGLSPLPLLERMGALLAGISEEITRDFEVSLAAEERLRLVPRHPALSQWIGAIEISFDAEKRFPRHLRLEEPEGDVTEIRFSEVEVNPALDPEALAP